MTELKIGVGELDWKGSGVPKEAFDGGDTADVGNAFRLIGGARRDTTKILDDGYMVEGGLEPEATGAVCGMEGEATDTDTGVVLHHDKGPGIPA